MDSKDRNFPDGMVPLGEGDFRFACHPKVPCFTVCCKKVDLTLYPYDIIRLKSRLAIDSEQFMRQHAYLARGDNPFFPTVKLQMDENEQCPFLQEIGCAVYSDRPAACRMYPLERAVDRNPNATGHREFYFMTDHSYCKGHLEAQHNTVKSWVRNQDLLEYNAMSDLWTEMDTLFRQNPWKGEGAGGEKQQLAFMICYNIDGFRRFTEQHKLVQMFTLDKNFKKRIAKEDTELQKFGYDWLKLILTGKSKLVRK